LTRTFYEAGAAEEEDRRRRCGCGDSAGDGAIDVRWPLSLSRMRPASLLQRRLSDERNEARSSERMQLAATNMIGRREHLSTQIE
jgi:hypothetical protein